MSPSDVATSPPSEVLKPLPSEVETLQLTERQFEHGKAATRRSTVRTWLTAAAVEEPEETPAAPDTTSLNSILNGVVKAPGSTSIATVPNSPTTEEYELLAQVQTLDSYVSILTAFCVYNEHPQPYDITDPVQAAQFTQAIAKWRNYVLTGGIVKALAAYMPPAAISTESLNQTVASSDLHIELLTTLFGGFGFDPATLLELDSILTGVVSSLKDLSLSFESESATLDHFLTYYYFQTVAGTGGDHEPPALYEVRVRSFYLKVAQSSWKATVGKSSIQSINFSMNYTDMSTDVASALVARDMATINATIQKLTGKDAASVNQLMNMKAIHADPQPA